MLHDRRHIVVARLRESPEKIILGPPQGQARLLIWGSTPVHEAKYSLCLVHEPSSISIYMYIYIYVYV